ncbi:MAG: hypothetical protein ABI347_11875 [Nitrososphaera sp.]
MYLIIGGVLLAAGLGIGAFSTFSVTKQVMQASAIIDKTTLEPGLSTVSVIKGLPAGHQLFLSLTGDPVDVPLNATIIGPDGEALASYDIQKLPFTGTASTRESGDTTLEVKNMGSRAIVISGGLISTPVGPEAGGVSVQDNSSLQNLVAYGVGILVGIVIIVAGIVLLIIGAVKYVKGRKAGQSPTPAS